MNAQFLTLEVPRHHVKAVKTALESKELRTRNCKITQKPGDEEVYLLQSRIAVSKGSMTEEGKNLLLRDLNLLSLQENVNISTYEVSHRSNHCYKHKMNINGAQRQKNDPLSRTLRTYLESLDASFWADLDYDAEDLIQGQRGSFLKYTVASKPDGSGNEDFLFLPQLWLNDNWYDMIHNRLNRTLGSATNRTYWDAMLAHIAKEMKVSHIAFQRPLSRVVSSGKGDGEQVLNVQRRPQLAPLWSKGKFPDFVDLEPSQQDFDKAIWISTKQHGITQIWAPAYTMFSPGNVEEKGRLLDLVASQIAKRTATWAAVDMYAGIGYFAFSYVKTGFDKVICFEINPWSIEGLKRGAAANGWRSVLLTEHDVKHGLKRNEILDPRNRLLIFHMDNNKAVEIVGRLERLEGFPPIMHVNLGLLPSSSASWCDGVRLLGYMKGGWLHVHENIPTDWRYVLRVEAIKAAITSYAQARWQTKSGRRAMVTWAPIRRVKSYAPG